MPSHKMLKSVVRSIVDSFMDTLNYGQHDYIKGYIVQAAWDTGATELRADLLTGLVDPSPLLVPDVARSIARYVKDFPNLVDRSLSSIDFITSAELIITIDPTTKRLNPIWKNLESPVTCGVQIVDDHRKTYEYTFRGWWYTDTWG